MTETIYEIVSTWGNYIVFVGKYDKNVMKWRKEYTVDRSFKTLSGAENYVLKCKGLYESGMSHEDVIQELRKCLSCRSYEKLYIRKRGK